jgi:hypothetical protein
MAPCKRLSYIGTKRAASVARIQDQAYAIGQTAKAQPQQFVVCVEKEGFPASLEKRKIYLSLPDREAEQLGLVRVIDESGEDYLYPKELFSSIDLPPALSKMLAAA